MSKSLRNYSLALFNYVVKTLESLLFTKELLIGYCIANVTIVIIIYLSLQRFISLNFMIRYIPTANTQSFSIIFLLR